MGHTLWTADPDGTAATRILDAGWLGGLAFSPDGSRLAFERDDAIEVMNADGSARTQLTTDSPSGTVETTWESDYEVPDSSDVIPFVKVVIYSYSWEVFYAPAFSPDGRSLAVARSSGTEIEREICAVEALGEEACIFEEPGQYSSTELECRDCVGNIVAIDALTGAPQGQLTAASTEWHDSDPVYSVDGKLAFTRTEGGPNLPRHRIMVVGSPGSSPTPLTSGEQDRSPDFSPDGSTVFYLRDGRVASVPAGGGAISVLDVEGSELAVSPDGTQLLLRQDLSGPGIDPGLVTVSLGSTGTKAVAARGASPAWQPIPVPPPAPPAGTRARAKAKAKVRLNRRGRAVVGTIRCGSTGCRLTPLRARLRIAKRRFAVRAIVQKRVAAGKAAKVRIAVGRKALAALQKAGRGRLTVKVWVADATGPRAVVFKPVVLPPRGKSGRG